MIRQVRSWKDRLLAAFGSAQAPAQPGDRELCVYILKEKERVLVGTLSSVDDRWVFKYAPAYAEDSTSSPISAFPDKKRIYASEYLWPFFDVRLPPLDREDIRQIVQREHIEEHDTLRLLALLSRRTVTSPYEFELH